ncbi:MAG: sulfatase-like hydrolase/transferase [Thermoanaerobaculia bacterium]
MPRLADSLRRALAVQSRQLPAFALAAALYALAELGVGLVAVSPAVGGAAALLLAAATVALHALGMALATLPLEAIGGGWARGRFADGAKTALVALAYLLVGASLFKVAATGVHLGAADLWFLAANAPQLLAEESPLERAAALFALALGLALAAGLFALLRRARAATGAGAPGRAGWGLAAAAALAGAGLATIGRDALRLAPEVALARRALEATPPPVAARAANLPLPAWAPPADLVRRNVVVVLLESIPWRRLEGPDARPGTTPNLDRLSREAIVFRRSYAASTHSDYAQAAVLSSLYPCKTPAHDAYDPIAYPRVLPWDLLRSAGYRSAIFSTQNERWGNLKKFLSTAGLELLRDSTAWPDAPHRGIGADSKVFEDTALAAFLHWLDAAPGRPFVAYLNFQATHFPYVTPSDFPAPFPRPAPVLTGTSFLRYPTAQAPAWEDRFHSALAYVDREVGRLRAALATRGLAPTTALLVTPDHGEAFYEHENPTHGGALYEEQVRTLTWLVLPGEPARAIDAPVSTLDFLPALARWLGLPRHPAFQGDDRVLAPDYDGRGRAIPFCIQGITRADGLVLDGWKYFVDRERGFERLYDLTRDPDETRDLAATAVARRDALAAALDDWIARERAYYRERRWELGEGPPPLPAASAPAASRDKSETPAAPRRSGVEPKRATTSRSPGASSTSSRPLPGSGRAARSRPSTSTRHPA